MLPIVPSNIVFSLCILYAQLINALSFSSNCHFIHLIGTITEFDYLLRFQWHDNFGRYSFISSDASFGSTLRFNYLNIRLNFGSSPPVLFQCLVCLLPRINNLAVFPKPLWRGEY